MAGKGKQVKETNLERICSMTQIAHLKERIRDFESSAMMLFCLAQERIQDIGLLDRFKNGMEWKVIENVEGKRINCLFFEWISGKDFFGGK